MLGASPEALTDKNLYIYCDNNPVMRTDATGDVWESVFDIASLVVSIVDVCVNPSDPMAWVGLVGDTIDLIPFVTGVGELAKVARVGGKAIDAIDNATDAVKVAKNGWKVGDDITTLTKAGNSPGWSTVQKRYWKNEAFYNGNSYSVENLQRMFSGRAPLVERNGKYYSMELHHKVPQRNGGGHSYDNLIKVAPWEHAAIDPYRYFKP